MCSSRILAAKCFRASTRHSKPATSNKRKPRLPKKTQKPAAASSSPMSLDLLEKLTQLMKENDLNTVEVRDGDKRVIIKRGALVAASGSAAYVPAFAPAAAPANAHSGTASGTTTGAADEAA